MPVLPLLVGLVAVLGSAGREKGPHGTVALAGMEYKAAELTEEEKARPSSCSGVNILLIIAAIVSLLFSGYAPCRGVHAGLCADHRHQLPQGGRQAPGWMPMPRAPS